MTALLEVRDLSVDFHTPQGVVTAVRRLNLTIAAGESIAVVGESGSGKSVTGMALLGLLESNAVVGGSILFEGTEVTGASEAKLRQLRGTGVGMVFQDSLDSLNPVYTIGAQLQEVLRVRRRLSRRDARTEALRLLSAVGIPQPEHRLRAYPHQFSGGMRQRVCIALAIALKPRLLIADEPTTALDVTVQAGILRLLHDLQTESDMGLLFVTHDLSVARLVANRIVVMRAGEIVEEGDMDEVFTDPKHPYTRALFDAHPARADSWEDLATIDDIPQGDESATHQSDPDVDRGDEAVSHGR